jgi:RNA polymerase sigma-70 factor (ECF subfamily)
VKEAEVPPGEQELIQRCLSGDSAAFAQLVEPMRGRIFRLICVMMSNEEDASDVYQEVLLKTWLHLDQFRQKSSFTSWMYSIAVNTTIKRRKQRTRLRSRHLETDDEVMTAIEDGSPVAHPGEMADRHERIEQLHTAVEGLSPMHRAVIVLREVEDLSYEEIAEDLGISIGTVMSRLHNARKKLRILLEEDAS